MSVWIILLIALNILMLAGLGLCFFRLSNKREDDPRLSYGLKLLQSKISVLEDLSDKTEVQVKQLVSLLENKINEVKSRVDDADDKIKRVDGAMKKTLEVAEIFQEHIPHEEIVERKVSNKYINAARLAHQGASAEEIQSKIDLPSGELDFILKLNKEQLMFSEEQLPAWVDKHPLEANEALFEPPQVNIESLEKLGSEFKQACREFAERHRSPTETPLEDSQSAQPQPEPAGNEKKVKKEDEVVPYQFKRSDVIYD